MIEGELPTLAATDSVQVYLLVSSFPYNAPSSIVKNAGSDFISNAAVHSGIGIWDTTTNERFSLEFVSQNYVGGLLPNVTSTRRTLEWRNAGKIVVTNPLAVDSWTHSQLVTTTGAVAYSELATYINQNAHKYAYFQPVSAYSNSTMCEKQGGDAQCAQGLLVAPLSSYSFVSDVFVQLGSYGCDLSSILSVYFTSLAYYGTSVSTISWSTSSSSSPPQAVIDYYYELSACYEASYKVAAEEGGGEGVFVGLLQRECYKQGHALVFHSPNSVYNITLVSNNMLREANSSASLTPSFFRFQNPLAQTSTPPPPSLAVMDVVVVCLFFLFSCAGLFFFLKSLFCTQRRRLSFELERVAAEQVGVLLQGQEEKDDLYSYFYERPSAFFAWGSRSPSSRAAKAPSSSSSAAAASVQKYAPVPQSPGSSVLF